jgi:hypothetical protein
LLEHGARYVLQLSPFWSVSKIAYTCNREERRHGMIL